MILSDRCEQHAKGSDTGMTAVMVQVRDLAATMQPWTDAPDAAASRRFKGAASPINSEHPAGLP
jgi:hypothetical protein